MTLFALLTRGRTGSTPLIHDIDQHPNIVCHQELFRPVPVFDPFDKAPTYEAVKLDISNISAEEYLRDVKSATPNKKVGFKALMFHLDLRKEIGLQDFMFESKMPIIFLTRDPVRAALSAAIAKERNLFNIHTDGDQQNHLKRRVALDPNFVADEAGFYAHWAEHWQATLRELEMPHIVVTYEQYVSNRLAVVNSIFRFLDVQELAPFASKFLLRK